MSAPTRQVKLKLTLIGEQAVGKTSLVHRFVSHSFDDRYITTLGFVVSKKTVNVDLPAGPVVADLIISDIMGKRAFLDLFGDAYFHGTQGVLAVFDVTRKETLSTLGEWIARMQDAVGAFRVVVLGNKIDLADRRVTTDADLMAALGGTGPVDLLYTSAKTGEHVEEAFLRLTRAVLESVMSQAPGTAPGTLAQ
ncbi:MAG TPA: Rab family GTPase [Thermoplasmata archaeon]|nr:Rab family GTPase [Thermoplasmata archaeon]